MSDCAIENICVSFAFTRDDIGELIMRFDVIKSEKEVSSIFVRLEEFLQPNNPFPIIPLKIFLAMINEPLASVDKDNPWVLSPVELFKKEDNNE